VHATQEEEEEEDSISQHWKNCIGILLSLTVWNKFLLKSFSAWTPFL